MHWCSSLCGCDGYVTPNIVRFVLQKECLLIGSKYPENKLFTFEDKIAGTKSLIQCYQCVCFSWYIGRSPGFLLVLQNNNFFWIKVSQKNHSVWKVKTIIGLQSWRVEAGSMSGRPRGRLVQFWSVRGRYGIRRARVQIGTRGIRR